MNRAAGRRVILGNAFVQGSSFPPEWTALSQVYTLSELQSPARRAGRTWKPVLSAGKDRIESA